MSPLTRIICLANSWKLGDRCIAGINPETGQWIRPVSHLPDGRVPSNMRLIDGTEPELLDILEIPLAERETEFGFESENRFILPGIWRRVGKAKPRDLLAYYRSNRYILHNPTKYVTVPFLQAQPLEKRRTLQLVQAVEFSIKGVERRSGGTQWQGNITTNTGQRLSNLSITDPSLVAKLEYAYSPKLPCWVTISLSLPHRPPYWEGDDPCWKLIAAVIECEPMQPKMSRRSSLLLEDSVQIIFD